VFDGYINKYYPFNTMVWKVLKKVKESTVQKENKTGNIHTNSKRVSITFVAAEKQQPLRILRVGL
jgi:hypothetical protein